MGAYNKLCMEHTLFERSKEEVGGSGNEDDNGELSHNCWDAESERITTNP